MSAATGTVLVLGATGFVGRHVCASFTSSGHRVVAAARSQAEGLAADRFRAFDLAQAPAEETARLLREERIDVVVNSIGSIWGAEPREMVERCTAPTYQLLEALALMPRRPRLVQLGSVLEYGSPPATAYGQAKLAATQAVLAADARGEAEALVLRIANAAGPGAPAVSLLGRVAAHLRAADREDRDAVVELSQLRAHRDYVDVRDVAEAVRLAAASTATGQILDVGRGEAVPVRALVDELIRLSGVPAKIIERDDSLVSTSADDWIQVDAAPAYNVLGWRPHRSLEEALQAFWVESADVVHK